ncbi:MAG: hypothetical protein NC311_11485 [Muribaculaceae bacterium]|nr:hypothetical protein [Muribaculaceae bacterium]
MPEADIQSVRVKRHAQSQPAGHRLPTVYPHGFDGQDAALIEILKPHVIGLWHNLLIKIKMENIYQETIGKVSEGSRFSVDLERRNLKVDGRHVIKEGAYEGLLGVERVSMGDALREIERLYLRYRHSIPSERSDRKRRLYFNALDERHLSDTDMMFGERRETAQAALELYVLCSVLNGSLRWDEAEMGKWFWKSPGAEGLVILKKWVTNE